MTCAKGPKTDRSVLAMCNRLYLMWLSRESWAGDFDSDFDSDSDFPVSASAAIWEGGERLGGDVGLPARGGSGFNGG